MMVHLCPTGSEGASYAMFTTVNNSALNLSAAISTTLLGIWDVSKEALSKGFVNGLVNLTLLTTFCQISGVFFVGLLPRTKDDLTLLNHDSTSSVVGGTIFLAITFLSILYALVVGVLNVVAPGWAGES
jgi:BT1 family